MQVVAEQAQSTAAMSTLLNERDDVIK